MLTKNRESTLDSGGQRVPALRGGLRRPRRIPAAFGTPWDCLTLAGLVAALLSGCGPKREPPGAASGAAEKPKTRLQNGAHSEWELGEMVLQALKDRNRTALQALRITEQEYKEHVFPEFEEAKGTIPVDFHWYHLNVRSHAGLQDALESFGGKSLELLDVLPTKGITRYATYELWNKVELMVRYPDGNAAQVRIFGSVVHMDGQWKLLSFPS